ATVCALISGTGPAAASDSSDLFANTNASRAQYGLGALAYDSAASSIAQSWSAQLASAGSLAHNPNLASQISAQVTNDWTRIGENVGYAGDANALENAFMGSQAHKDNILGDYNRVGVGTTRGGDGRLWAAVVFIKGPALAAAPAVGSPTGSYEAAVAGAGWVSVQGWALDPDTTGALEIDVTVDGYYVGAGTANQSRSDVAAAYPSYGAAHGFSFSVGIWGGTHSVCVAAVNVGPGAPAYLGCRSVFVNINPIGRLEQAYLSVPGRLAVQGWALDPDTKGTIEVDISVDGGFAGVAWAWYNRPDVGRDYPYWGPNHGYWTTVPISGGRHTVCAHAINSGPGANTVLGCRVVDIPANPIGAFETAWAGNGGYWFGGWALDPDVVGPIEVDVSLDGYYFGLVWANGSRNDVAGAFPAYGPNHGFMFRLNGVPGTHTACAWAINQGAGRSTLLGCRTVAL
ncbi:MAG: CAP domain-containing protein, partial [Acidimicrobiales bacterium]